MCTSWDAKRALDFFQRDLIIFWSREQRAAASEAAYSAFSDDQVPLRYLREDTLKTPQVLVCLANPHFWSLAYTQGEYKLFFIICYNLSALFTISPTAEAKLHFSNHFCTCSQKQGPLLANFMHHLCWRTSWTSSLLQGHLQLSRWCPVASEQSVAWKASAVSNRWDFNSETVRAKLRSCWTFKIIRYGRVIRKGEKNCSLAGGNGDSKMYLYNLGYKTSLSFPH